MLDQDEGANYNRTYSSSNDEEEIIRKARKECEAYLEKEKSSDILVEELPPPVANKEISLDDDGEYNTIMS